MHFTVQRYLVTRAHRTLHKLHPYARVSSETRLPHPRGRKVRGTSCKRPIWVVMLGTISGGTWDTAMRPSYPPDVDLSLIMDFGVDLRTIMHIQEVQQVTQEWKG